MSAEKHASALDRTVPPGVHAAAWGVAVTARRAVSESCSCRLSSLTDKYCARTAG